MKLGSNLLQILQILKVPGTPPTPPTPPKSMPKSDLKSDPEKTPPNCPKVLPKAPQTDPNGSPNPLNSAKSASQNAYKKTCAQSGANEVSQDPLRPQKLCSRLSGSIVFTFPPVTQKSSKMAPNDPLLEPFGPPNGPKVAQRSLQKNIKKSLRFLMPPGLQTDSKMTSKMVVFFWHRPVFWGSGCRLPPKCPPEGQNTPKSTEINRTSMEIQWKSTEI